ncbi:glycolate oxidase subunit GlcE [Burkholderia vietnamiensis]|uniref:glycolate oxidase subunit GlcE n=1 Tax=Burkholderia vietnamiensis TaxID=60552 RepID=UPI001B93F1EE|nr:glycolate oxidase subunit GlcE [Burkholderia vietnamiensis]MBR8002256.1 glycolate oxidase subunit GlcE [Burkholderia vietnamiensis]
MEEDDIVAGWAERVRAASADGRPLRVRGGGTKDWYGQTLDGEILDTRAFQGVVSYDPAELVVTVRAACGAPRDFVLGVTLMNGRGEVLRFGGQVVKNVAGYDVSRLMAGALGTLGLMLELSIKVLPVPVAEVTLKFEMTATDAVRKLNEWGGHPLPVSASGWRNGTLVLRLSGAEAAVKSAKTLLGGEVVDAVEAERFWAGLREHTDPFFNGIPPGYALWRLSLPSITEPMHLAGNQLMEWGGAQRWWITDADAQTVRMSAKQAGGHATLFRAGDSYDRSAGVFTPLPAPLMKIHRGLKAAFDPARIFNRGRLYPDL